MSALTRWYRAVRYGRPVVIVSGLPRSGTSMMMRMLQAGGMSLVTDGARPADASNPLGYFEDERVKDLDKGGDASWVGALGGRALKVVSFLLPYLPETNNYQVIFLRRDLREVLASQDAMLEALGTSSSDAAGRDRLAAGFRTHLVDVQRHLDGRACFQVLDVEYADVISRPLEQAEIVARFLGRPLDTQAMAAAVVPALRRQR